MISFNELSAALVGANWVEIFAHLIQAAATTFTYWCALYEFIFKKVSYTESTVYGSDTWAKVQVFSLSLIFKLWSLKHYRSPSFKQDMIDNLRNVAVPGTGIPLSVFCHSYYTCLAYVLLVNPFICFMGAVNKVRQEPFVKLEDSVENLVRHFTAHLLHPNDWFSFWRLNCRLVSYHSAITSHPDYLQEDKWTFLTLGKSLNVPVSPYFDHFEHLVCKNKNIEGGMGIFFYHNAAHGGDWILQERLTNAEWLSKLLPNNAPLSTMRVITTSSYALDLEQQSTDSTNTNTNNASADVSEAAHKYVRAESGLLRLGRANASTDHSSILFDVDITTGTIKQGTSNAHWYQLWNKAINCPWLPPKDTVLRHADPPYPLVTGNVIPDMQEALKIVVESHYKMMPNVPIVGWDVAFTPAGIYLLEVNLSCNFFKGSFDVPRYIGFVDQYWRHLQALENKQGIHGYDRTTHSTSGDKSKEE